MPATTTTVARIGLAAGTTPQTRTAHSLNIRARVQTAITATVRAALYEGSTNRSGTLESPPLTTTITSYTLPISDAAAASITSYSALTVRIWGYSSTGQTATIEIEDAWLQIPAGSATPVTLTSAPATATAAGRSVLLGMFWEGAHGQASATAAVKTAAPLQCSASSAAATASAAINLITVPVLACAASSAQATAGTVTLIVPPVLQCVATLTATGRSMLLGSFLDASWAFSSTSGALTAATWLSASANTAQATTGNVLLGLFLGAETGQASGTVTLITPVPIPAGACSATSGGLLIALQVPGIAPLILTASDAVASGSFSLSRTETLQPSACTATSSGRVTMCFWADPTSASSDATLSGLYVKPILECSIASIAATATAELQTFGTGRRLRTRPDAACCSPCG